MLPHFTRISKRSSQKDACKTLTKIFMPGPMREAHKLVIKSPSVEGDLTRSWYKNLPRASHKSCHTSTCKTWHLQDLQARTSWRGSTEGPHQDPHTIFWQGPQKDHARTKTVATALCVCVRVFSYVAHSRRPPGWVAGGNVRAPEALGTRLFEEELRHQHAYWVQSIGIANHSSAN